MAVTQGRNEGGKTRQRRTMTSDSVSKPAEHKNSRRAEDAPIMYIERRPQTDVLDTGLEDHKWHYVWVSKNDPVTVHGYYVDGYRFVRYEDVADRLKEDERRAFLYHADENGRVSFGDENRLMRIPQEEYQARMRAALGGDLLNPAKLAQEAFERQLEEGKYAGTVDKSAQVSVDEDNGVTETRHLQEEGGTK